MKIGINARFLDAPYTGIGKYTYNLLSALAELDGENEYLLFTPQLADLHLPDNFKQIRLPEADYSSPGLRKIHWEQKLLPREMQKWKVEVAHFLYPSNPNKHLGIPVVVTVHDIIPWKLPEYSQKLRSKLYHFNTKNALRKADHLITVSQFSAEELKKLVRLEDKKLSVIPLAAPLLSHEEIPLDIDLRRNFLIYVGGYDPRKNVPLLMIAYQKFIANHYPIDLILVGAKNKGLETFITDEFREKVAGRFPVKPKGNIIFTDTLSDGELAALYKKALALVHPSVYEGFNLPLVEAMQYDLPMVISDILVHREVAQEAAFYADPKNENTFGLALHAFLNDPLLQRQLRQNAAFQKQQYDWKKTAQQTLEVYRLFR